MPTLDERLAEIVAHAYGNAPAFRQIMDQAGVTPDQIKTLSDLPRIPVTSKDRLIQMQQQAPPFGGWLAVPMDQVQRIYISPGPCYDPQGYNDIVASAAVQAFHAAGIQAGDICLNTFLYHMVPAGLWLDEALREIRATVMPIGPGNTDLTIMVMMALKANVFIGTPSFLDILYNKAAQMGMPPAALPLRKAFFSAEPYPATLRQKFEGDYGLRTAQAYATADLGLIGFEHAGKSGLYMPDSLIVEIVDPQTGQAMQDGDLGEVIVTTFSHTYPLIRFGTGDLSISERDENGIRRLKGVLGRTGEAVKVRGMFLHPNQLKAAAGAFPGIKQVAAVVTRSDGQDVLTVQIELVDPNDDRDNLAKSFGALLRQHGQLRIDHIEFVGDGAIDATQRMIRDERTPG